MDFKRVYEIIDNGKHFSLDIDKVNEHNVRANKYFLELEEIIKGYEKKLKTPKKEVKPAKKENKNVTSKRVVSKKG